MGIRYSTTEASADSKLTIDEDMKCLDTVSLVYYDPITRLIEDEKSFEGNLRQLTTSWITFNDFRLCKQWLQKQSDEQIFLLIIRDNYEKRNFADILPMDSIPTIYLLSSQKFTINHRKVQSITVPLESFIPQLSEDISWWRNIFQSQSIEIYPNRNKNIQMRTISNILLMEILRSSKYLPFHPSPQRLISYHRQYYSHDRYTMDSINEFEQTYSPEKSIQVLIDEQPIAKITNKALKDQDISLLFDLRFFLSHLFDQLKSKHLSNITVYRKQIFSNEQLESIRRNTINYLIFNYFLLAHTQPSKCSDMEIDNDQYQSVLLQIDAEFIDETTLFAYTDSNQSDVLFMCTSLFQIKSIKKESSGKWMIHLVLIEHKQISVFNEKIGSLRETRNPLLLIEYFNQLNKSKIFYEKLLEEYPPDHPLTCQIHDQFDQIQPVSLTKSIFYLIGLPILSFEYSNEMIQLLQFLTDHSMIILEHPYDIDFDLDSIKHQNIFIFTTEEIHSFMNQRFPPLTSFFLLGEHHSDQWKSFDNFKDFLFELFDQVSQCYRWEMKEDSRSGETTLSNQKKQLADQIHYQLKKLYRIKGDLFLEESQSSISKSTKLFWLKSTNQYQESLTQELKKIFTSVQFYVDIDQCYSDLVTKKYKGALYLIIDDEYKEKDVIYFNQLKSIKQIYRFISNVKNEKKLLLKILHHLIDHYNQLSNEFEEAKDLDSSKEMLQKRRVLCEMLLPLL